MSECSVADCSRRSRARGLCTLHYQRWLKHGDPLHIPIQSYRRPVRDRLFANTVTTASGCIEKRGTGNPAGYRLIQVSGRTLMAHRVSYELTNGPIPDGMQVLHRCDNPPCINPDHLFLGTQLDNMHDMRRKGRKVVLRGESAPGARLTTADVAEIRSSTEPQRVLAERFHVCPSNISIIKSRRTWV